MRTTVKIESNKEYNHIVMLHALRTNESEVEIFFDDNTSIIYDRGSFVRGRVYDINCVKLVFNEGCSFVGTIIQKEKLQQLLS
ncbi:MAG: hypothetical protein FWC41_05870 [Firmicutes bacterium]|nr:hypothetical protein [Bacillota bacterium]